MNIYIEVFIAMFLTIDKQIYPDKVHVSKHKKAKFKNGNSIKRFPNRWR